MANENQVKHGGLLYSQYCQRCHGGALPDLGRSPVSIHENFAAIVRKGLLAANGMPNFGNRLSEEDVKDLRGYILATARQKTKK